MLPPNPAVSPMCDKCQQLETKIQHYRMIATQAFDSLTVERIKEFVRELELRKEGMHR